jgi:hypothetical protein
VTHGSAFPSDRYCSAHCMNFLSGSLENSLNTSVCPRHQLRPPTDMWSPEDDALFLAYCPNPRDKCYHAMSRDSACRPHELLKLRIMDVRFKVTPDKKQYAEVTVSGKTGTRSIPLIDSIPYIKDWINQHPQSGNKNSILLCGLVTFILTPSVQK